MVSSESLSIGKSVHLIYGKSVAICDSSSYCDYTSKHYPPVLMLYICGYTFFVAVRPTVWRSTTVGEIRKYCVMYFSKYLSNVAQ